MHRSSSRPAGEHGGDPMLDVWPLVFVLVGLALYAVLGGADFGAGFWQFFAGKGEHADEIRDQAHHSMAPVWEANHVWLIFVLTVMLDRLPARPRLDRLDALHSALHRGRGDHPARGRVRDAVGNPPPRTLRTIDSVFGVSSLLTPFALGAVVGGIASLRVPVGNAAGNLVHKLGEPDLDHDRRARGRHSPPTSASVYLAADTARHGEAGLESDSGPARSARAS